MKKFVIEREWPGAGELTASELKAVATKTCEAVNNLDAPYHWIETYVTDNKLYCVHIAPDRETVIEHARQGGFPVNNIAEVKFTIDPTTSAIRI